MEIIKRKQLESEILKNEFTNIQYGYNNYGHLTIRIFNKTINKDFLIVLTMNETKILKRFLKHNDINI